MERKELRVWKNRQSAEKSRRNKDDLIESLRYRVAQCETRIEDFRQMNGHYRSVLLGMGLSEASLSTGRGVACFGVTQPSALEPALEGGCVPCACDASIGSTDAADSLSTCSWASDNSNDSDDMASVQRRRRLRRVQIMKEKRLQGRQARRPMMTAMRSPCASPASSCSLPLDTDPKTLRKLKNRESAARSRQKKDDLVDGLTCQLCEYFVLLDDLAAEQAHFKDLLDHPQSDMDLSDLSCSSRCSSPWDDCGLDLLDDLPDDLDQFLLTSAPSC